jgi:release factor glutamine methyltransferase
MNREAAGEGAPLSGWVELGLVEAVNRAASWLEGEGVISPRLNAEALLSESTGLSRVELYVHYQRPLRRREAEAFLSLLLRRLAHEPLQYILGRRGFRRLELEVDPRVLIPRPETELLVERALQKMAEDPSLEVVLDLGTGSGNIALAVAQENPAATVIATDVSPGALAVAERNAARNGLAGRVRFLGGDLFAALPAELRGRIHLLLSNPPYVSAKDYGELPPEVRDFEPPAALRSDGAGTLFHLRILDGARDWLAPGGWVILEGGADQVPGLREEALKRGFGRVEALYDLNGLPRFLECALPAS